MGYSNNKIVIERMRPLLDQLLVATADISWSTENAHMFCYRLNEALMYAKKHGVVPYEGLKDKFMIRNKGNRALAELRVQPVLETLQRAMEKLVLSDFSSAVEIVGAAITNKVNEMFFPDAELNEEELKLVHTWGEKNGYFLVYGNGLTLTKNDPGEAKWTP